MARIEHITVTLDTEREPMLEVSLNDGTGDIPHQWTRTPDAYWIWEYVNDAGYYTWWKCDTAEGALQKVCEHWHLNMNDYPDAMHQAAVIDYDPYTEDNPDWEEEAQEWEKEIQG